MRADTIKKIVQRYYYHHGLNMSCTEFGVYGGWADVFVLQKNGYSHELEVKVSTKDFLGEIATLDYLLNRDSCSFNFKASKVVKHRIYTGSLRHYVSSMTYAVPNKFSFVMPSSLYQKLKHTHTNCTSEDILGGIRSDMDKIEEILKVTGYGLYVVTEEGDHRRGDTLIKVLAPRFLQKVKISEYIFHKFCQRCFQENYNNHIRQV